MADLSTAEIAPAARVADQSAFSWSAALAGGVVIAALTLLLMAFGAGMGFAAVSPWSDAGVSAGTFTTAAGIYLIVIAMLSSTIGGYLAGRLRTRWTGLHSEEVVFRDTAHGFVAWAAAIVFSAAALGTAMTAVAGGAASGLGQGAMSGSLAQAGGYYVDLLLRSQPGGAGAQASAQSDPALRAEVGRILARGVRPGSDLASYDRSYLAEVVAARTGMSRTAAEQRVNDVIVEAKAALDTVRHGAVKLALWLTAALLVGAFAASLAAIEGGQLRDGRWKGVIATARYHRAVQEVS